MATDSINLQESYHPSYPFYNLLFFFFFFFFFFFTQLNLTDMTSK